VAIVAADNAGANGTTASLSAALDKAGVSYVVIKGGDSETDTGYQSLMREAAKDNPDVLISLYSDDGCIGTIRGRAALGIEIPVITTGICSSSNVLDEVGDDAVGWHFMGVSTQRDTPEQKILQEILAPVLGISPEEVDSTSLGLGALAMIGSMSLATFSNMMLAEGTEVTGESLFEYVKNTKGLMQWPNATPIECGIAEKYPTICSFIFPVAEYIEGGEVLTVPGLENVSALTYLP
jgi:hypothetical protein